MDEFAWRFQGYSTEQELDEALDNTTLRDALSWPCPNETFALYLIGRESIRRGLEVIGEVEDEVEPEICDRILDHLALPYLQRIGYIHFFKEQGGAFTWLLNPYHPLEKTACSLDDLNPVVTVIAQWMLVKDRDYILGLRAIGVRLGKAPSR